MQTEEEDKKTPEMTDKITIEKLKKEEQSLQEEIGKLLNSITHQEKLLSERKNTTLIPSLK